MLDDANASASAQHVPVPGTESEQVQLNCRLQRSPSRCASPAEEHGREWAFTARLVIAFSAAQEYFWVVV